jgi:hypothetical protein
MNLASLSQDLYGFAIELRQVAYSMPGGHEDPLVRLSERMIHYAQEEAATSIRSPDRRGLLRSGAATFCCEIRGSTKRSPPR